MEEDFEKGTSEQKPEVKGELLRCPWEVCLGRERDPPLERS